LPTKIPINPVNAQRWVLALSSVASLMVALDVLVVSTALSSIRHSLGASVSELEWTVNAYSLSFAVLLITGSALGDRLGRRRLFAVGLGLFVTASAACALAPNVGLLIAARAIQGAAAALVAPLSLSLLSAAFGPERRGWALGIYSGVTGLAVLGGPVVGGAVTQGIAWQWVFWLNVPIGLVAIPLVLTRLAESYGPRARLDVRSLVLVAGATLGIVWGLMRGNRAGWGSAEVLIALAAGALLAITFIVAERRTKDAMLADASVPHALVLGRQCDQLPALRRSLQRRLLHGPVPAGHARSGTAGFRLATAAVDRDPVPDRAPRGGDGGPDRRAAAGRQRAHPAGSRSGLARSDRQDRARLLGDGGTAGNRRSRYIDGDPRSSDAVISSVRPADLGKASGTFTMMRQLGGVFGLSIAVAVFAGTGSYASAPEFSHGFAAAIGISAAFSIAGALIALWLPSRRSATAAAVDPAPVMGSGAEVALES